MEECSGLLEEADRPLQAGDWVCSPAVPFVPREEVTPAPTERPEGLWVDALLAIPNGLNDSASMGYDEWFRVICGIHAETGGSPEGLALAQDWSARSPKHDPAFLEQRVWPYIKGAGERGGNAVTGGTIMSLAARDWGWAAPLDDSEFPTLDERGKHVQRVDGLGDGGRGPRLVGAGRPDVGGGGVSHPRAGAVMAREVGGRRSGDGPERLAGDEADAAALWESESGDGDDGGRPDGAGWPEDGGGQDAQRRVGRLSEGFEGAAGDGDPEPPERRGVPQALHLCTDQANANRLVKTFGTRVLVAADKWHVWDGVRWRAGDMGEADVYRYACMLSGMVREEAKAVMRKARAAALGGTAAALAGLEDDEVEAWAEASGEKGQGAAGGKAAELAEALEKWSVRCEMGGTIETALRLSRKMLTVDAGLMDRNPWLLNVRNGVVDLRDGSLRPHRAEDLITKLADVEYRGLDHVCEDWERAVEQIAGERQVADFLRRWFGYCATGDISEQVFVVHWGDGSNGKSTILNTVSAVLGDYAGTAAPQLLATSSANGSEAHPTGIADLWGKRMVTAHETKEGAVLREDFIKQATGGDKIKARFMRADFFEFDPTHKIQLLTNSKPSVRGQDHGIWRRVLLVAYLQRFGSEEQVAEGSATLVGDKHLGARLSGDDARAGVLSWIVRGAVEWAQGGGLKAPDVVREASEVYREEQDRVGQWLRECCELEVAAPGSRVGGVGADDTSHFTFSEPLTIGMGGLFPSYVEWCKSAGFFALSRNRFLQELRRAAPRVRVGEVYEKGESGKRRKVLRVFGIRMLSE
jgi:P4 family phage/plasmid primase-like protien